MPNPNELTMCAVAAAGIIGLLWYASKQTDDVAVPDTQEMAHFGGLAAQAGLDLGAGTPLDTTYSNHGYHPGYDPDPSAQPVVRPRIGYPVLAGGNLTSVMHHGWKDVQAPAGNDWRLNPPEVAVL
jgi:hypothetical protein